MSVLPLPLPVSAVSAEASRTPQPQSPTTTPQKYTGLLLLLRASGGGAGADFLPPKVRPSSGVGGPGLVDRDSMAPRGRAASPGGSSRKQTYPLPFCRIRRPGEGRDPLHQLELDESSRMAALTPQLAFCGPSCGPTTERQNGKGTFPSQAASGGPCSRGAPRPSAKKGGGGGGGDAGEVFSSACGR